MKILIIGNGFDIAHGLPTKYMEFLDFCEKHREYRSSFSDNKLDLEFYGCTNRNIWMNYFLNVTHKNSCMKPGETWIDFEKEIADIIQELSDRVTGEDAFSVYGYNEFGKPLRGFGFNGSPHFGNGKLAKFIEGFEKIEIKPRKYQLAGVETKAREYYLSGEDEITDTPSFIAWIYHQLRDFIRAFEIYCLRINKAQVAHLGELNFDSVLSFNYTSTYEQLYGDDDTQYCYIHGKAQGDEHKTNLILGIDDRLTSGKESQDFSFARFKKYYQRIILKTGSEYKDWIKEAKYSNWHNNCVHIVGHSLDRTDHDVLYEFFDKIQFRIIVYYYNERDFEEKVQRVIQLLSYKGKNGRDELISRVHGSDWSIKFTYLYDEEEGLFKKTVTAANELQSIGS